VLVDAGPSSSVLAATRELRATLELIAGLRNSRRLPELLRTTVDRPGALADGVALWADFADADRLRVLQAVELADRVDAIHAWARNHLAELQIAETIRNDVGETVNKQQREYMLRQQLNAIKRELGESDDDVVGEFRDKLAALVDTGLVADSVTGFIAKELDRFEQMSAQSPEHSWVRTWLDRVFELPWTERSDDNLDLNTAQATLDADHYGLDDVKERIVEFLATRKLRRERGLDARVDADGKRAVPGAGSGITPVGPPCVG